MDLRHRFFLLSAVWGSAPGTIDQEWAALSQRYADPGRAYHTLAHLRRMFRSFDRYSHRLRDKAALSWAIFYHDVEYFTDGRDSEAASALWANRALSTLGAPPLLIKAVEGLILATGGHVATSPEERWMVDLDLEILAAPPSLYQRYAQAVRREWAHLGDHEFRLGRRAFVEASLARECLFQIHRHCQTWEIQARANLSRESRLHRRKP